MIEASLPVEIAGQTAATAAVAAALAGSITYVLCPTVARVAKRFGMVDEPRGWKTHERATPYLGGAAVITGYLIAVVVFGSTARVLALSALGLGLFALGTLDDRRNVDYRLRFVAVASAGLILGLSDYGWEVFSSDPLNALLTSGWCVVVVNAVNLLDLMDGAAASAAAVSAVSIALLAGVEGEVALAAASASLAASCCAFLRFNLADPPRIFLGNGGTMSIGLLLAGTTAGLSGTNAGIDSIAIGVALLGVFLFDLSFRVCARRLSGVSLLTAGPDSVANWLRARLGSPRWVALAIGSAQAIVSAVAIGGSEAGDGYAVAAVALLALAAIGSGAHLLQSGFPDYRAAAARRRAATLGC